MIPGISLEFFLDFVSVVEESSAQKVDNRNLTKIFQQAVHIYALMQDLNTGEEQTVLANSLKKTTKLAESVLRDSSLGALQGQEKRFWKAEAWFDVKTKLMVQYRSNEGPRTPMTEVILLDFST